MGNMENHSQNSAPKHLTILGAGVCGLYAALTALRAGYSVTLLEKESHVGGLATAHQFGGNHYDMGVHMLHAFDREIFEDVSQLMGEERLEVQLDARIRWGESTYRYPLKFADLVKEMPPLLLLRGVVGLLIAELKRAVSQVETDNAEDALIAFYGAPLYEFFFEEFTHRYWGIHPRDLSAEFIRRKMPRLSAVDFVRQKLLKFLPQRANLTTESSLEEETLHYSARGAKALPEALKQEILKLGGIIHTEVDVEAVVESMEEVTVTYQKDGVREEVVSHQLISTIPLSSLIPLCEEANEYIRKSAAQLRSKPIVIYGLLVQKESILDGLYTYYRNRIFHRVGEPKNAGLKVAEGHTVMIVELTCEVGDEKWENQIKERVISDLEAEGLCKSEEIKEWHVMRNAFGYPVYDLGFEVHLDAVESFLKTQPLIHSTGRQGAFTYPGMHRAMRLGADAVEQLSV